MHVKQSVEYLLHRKYEANGSCYCYARLGGRLGLLLGWCNLLPYTESKKISLPESRAGRREGMRYGLGNRLIPPDDSGW